MIEDISVNMNNSNITVEVIKPSDVIVELDKQGPVGPRGETGATGNGIANIEKTSTSGLVDTYTITYTNGDTTTFNVTNGAGQVDDVTVNGTSVLDEGVAKVLLKTINTQNIVGTGNINIDSLPPQTGHSGKFLTTDGTDASWATVDALPSQTGNNGKVLTTNGTTASWSNIIIFREWS